MKDLSLIKIVRSCLIMILNSLFIPFSYNITEKDDQYKGYIENSNKMIFE